MALTIKEAVRKWGPEYLAICGIAKYFPTMNSNSHVFFVNGTSGVGNDGVNTLGQIPDEPFLTITKALSKCTDGADDYIFVLDYSGGGATITVNKTLVHIIGTVSPWVPYARLKPATAVPGFTLGASSARVEIANLVIGGGDQTVAAILINGASYGAYIHGNVIGRDADAPALYGVHVNGSGAAPYLRIEDNWFYGADGAGIKNVGSAILLAGNATRCRISRNYIQDIGRTATPAIWLTASITNPQITDNHIKIDTDTGTGSAITLASGVDDGWISGNRASDGKDAPSNNPFKDAGSTNGWSENYQGIVAVLPA